MFTSAILKIEPGLISHLSIGVIMVFGYVLNRWKRLVTLSLVALSLLVLMMGNVFGFAAVSGVCGSICQYNQQQYSTYYQPSINTNNQCGFNNSISNQGVFPFQNYQTAWSNPSVYQQNPLYSGFGTCFNCQTSFNQPSTLQQNNGSFIIR